MSEYLNDKEHRQSIISLLLEMVASDKKLAVQEEKFVRDVASHLRLTPSDIQMVKDDPTNFKFVPPPEENERMNILYYILFAMAVDGEITQEEENFCYKIGLRLGFNDRMTADLIRVMKQYLNKEMPEGALIKEVKKYMN
ncbi:MAG: TerB family tellurite resistance protein [Saprospiraceae bacterium]